MGGPWRRLVRGSVENIAPGAHPYCGPESLDFDIACFPLVAEGLLHLVSHGKWPLFLIVRDSPSEEGENTTYSNVPTYLFRGTCTSIPIMSQQDVPVEDFETAHQLGQSTGPSGNIPAELSFEEVIKNRTAPVSC